MKAHVANQKTFHWLKPTSWWIVQAFFATCPCCNSIRYSIAERKRGLPCQCCEMPTDRILSNIYVCKNCGFSEERFFPEGETHEDPLFCDHCNPHHR